MKIMVVLESTIVNNSMSIALFPSRKEKRKGMSFIQQM